MYPRARSNNGIDDQGLQADVMRFMAIIAFCLVAIMALVREGAPAEETPAELVQVEKDVAPLATTTAPVSAPVAAPEKAATKKVATKKVLTKIAVEAQPIKTKPEKIAKVVVSVEATTEPKTEPAMEPAMEPAIEPKIEEGLTLRFASDKDFLRLIANGKVNVYLFNDAQALRLGSNYSFGPSSAPQQLYEILPETIPSAIHDAAGRSSAALGDFRWGISIPGRIASRIEALVAIETSGQLVINRFGEVQHQQPGRQSDAGS